MIFCKDYIFSKKIVGLVESKKVKVLIVAEGDQSWPFLFCNQEGKY
jgi:hypothetical protein